MSLLRPFLLQTNCLGRYNTGMSMAENPSQRPLVVLRPQRGKASLNLLEIWQFRDLLTTLAQRDIKLRYRQTALGAIWVVFQPLLAAGIFSLVFGAIGKFPSDGLPYFLFAFAGQLGWGAFANTLTKSGNCLVQNSALVSKVFFPRLILPFSTIFSTLLDFGVGLVVMIFLLAINGINPGLAILTTPLWLLALMALGLGLGLFAAALTVSYRDVQYILPVLIPLMMYATPVAYSLSAAPPKLAVILAANPIAPLIEGLRWSLTGRGTLNWLYVAYAVAFTLVMLFLGMVYFRNMERRFADVI